MTIPILDNVEAEKAVLGSILLHPPAYHTVSNVINGKDFFYVRHQMIWEAIVNIFRRKDALDYVVLSEELSNTKNLEEIGGEGYLTLLVNNTPTSVNVGVYAELVKRMSLRRELMRATVAIQKLALDANVPIDKVLAESERVVFSVNRQRVKKDITSLQDALSVYYENIEKALGEDNETSVGTPTGFHDVDGLLGGLQKSDFIVFAGRTGMGKTSWLLSTTLNVARRGQTVCLFTLEMSIEQVVQRLIAMETGISIQKLRSLRITKDELIRLVEVIGRLSELSIYMDDSPALTPQDIHLRSRHLQYEVGLSIIVIDYMQLMTMGNSYRTNRVQEVSHISRLLKGVARELNVTVLAASQLSRAVEYREDKRPMLSDLRESGSIEQDADAVLFMYRDDYYNKEASEFPGMTEINLAKHRHGPTGTVYLHFNENTTKFSDALAQSELDMSNL